MTTCNGCGSCCDPVTLPITAIEMALDPRCSPESRRWLLEDLTAMPRREALDKEPWLRDERLHGMLDAESGLPKLGGFFYRCRHFDDETRSCTNYENRPPACRNYPWVGAPPPPGVPAALPPTCSFRADIGQPVLFRKK